MMYLQRSYFFLNHFGRLYKRNERISDTFSVGHDGQHQILCSSPTNDIVLPTEWLSNGLVLVRLEALNNNLLEWRNVLLSDDVWKTWSRGNEGGARMFTCLINILLGHTLGCRARNE